MRSLARIIALSSCLLSTSLPALPLAARATTDGCESDTSGSAGIGLTSGPDVREHASKPASAGSIVRRTVVSSRFMSRTAMMR